MTKTMITQADIDSAVKWLKANSKVIKQSTKLLHGDGDLCDEILLRPQLLLDIAGSTYKSAAAAGAPREVLNVLKTRRDYTKEGLARLPSVAYSWLSLCGLRGVESKAKAHSLLTKAASRAPDRINREALMKLAGSVAARPKGGGGAASVPCLLCCAIACLECGPGCLVCCVVGCLICLIMD